MSTVISFYRVLVVYSFCSLCERVSKVSPNSFNAEEIVKKIMPSQSVQSGELFGSKYDRSEARFREMQQNRARIDGMRGEGERSPNEGLIQNPMDGKPKSEYVSDIQSGAKSINSDDSAGSNLDITVEGLFATTKGKAKKDKHVGKKKSGETSEFQRFVYDDKFGITVHNDMTVDYMGTDGSLFEFVEVNTRHKEVYTKKQLYDSDEFMPKMPENPKKYYILKRHLLDTDELTIPSEEVKGKKSTLSLMERMNKITRATRVKKAPYTFKRKKFETKNPNEEDENEEIKEETYEDPALKDEEAEEWKRYNDPKNVDKIIDDLRKLQENELKEKEKKICNKELKKSEENIFDTIRTAIKNSDPVSLEKVKTTKKPSKTTKSKTVKSKKTTKIKLQKKLTVKNSKLEISIKISEPNLMDNIIISSSTLKPTVRKTVIPFEALQTRSNSHENLDLRADGTKVKKDQILFSITTLISTRGKTPSMNNSSIDGESTPQMSTKEMTSNTAKISTYTENITRVNITALDKTFTIKLSLSNSNISRLKVPVPSKSTISLTLPSSTLIKLKTMKTTSVPTFKKVFVKTIGIRKLTTKLKGKGKTTKTLSEKTRKQPS
ncbi:hypothetical protein WDU94_002503 [Cyamophila willieti]